MVIGDGVDLESYNYFYPDDLVALIMRSKDKANMLVFKKIVFLMKEYVICLNTCLKTIY